MGKDLKGKELGKGISQRKDGIYQGRYTDRFGKRRYVYGAKLGEVRIALAEAVTDDKNGKQRVIQLYTLDEWYKRWMELFKVPHIKESTVWVNDGYYNQRISPTLGGKKLTAITEMDIRELLANIKEEGYAYSTLEKVKKLLSQMFTAAIENNFAEANPTMNIKLPRNKEEKPIQALTQEEQKVFLSFSASKHYHDAYIVQLNTGIRPGELFALKRDDINFEEKYINIDETLLYKKGVGEKCGYCFHSPKTEASRRIIPMNAECEEALKKQLKRKEILKGAYPQADAELEKLIFVTNTNTPLNTSAYNSSIKRLIEKIRKNGYDMKLFTGHDIRHTFATRCYEAGIDPKTIQEYMGHSSLKMTMDIYTHLFKGHKSREMQKLSELNKSLQEAL